MRATASRAVLAALAASLTFSGMGTPASAGAAAVLPITITMPAAPGATISDAQYSSQDVWAGVLDQVLTPPSGISPLQRLQDLNPPNFRIHAGTDGGLPAVALPFNAPYMTMAAWDFHHLNSLIANTVGNTSGSTMINVRYAPDNMFGGTGPLGGNGNAEGALLDQTYGAFATYMANLVKYYNTATPPPGAVPPRPAGVGPIKYWEIWNEPDFSSENPRIPPTLPPPTGVMLTGVNVAGGTLVPGQTYTYRLTPITSTNQEGVASTAVAITLPANTNAVHMTWNQSINLGRVAAAYGIYGRSGTVRQLVVVGKDNPTVSAPSWTDKGTIVPSGAPPGSDSTLGGPVFSPLEYKALWDVTVPAMKAVDSTIKVVGPAATNPISIGGQSVITTAVTTGPGDTSNIDLRDFVQVLMTSSNTPDVISYHGYGGYQGAGDSDSSLMAAIPQMAADVSSNIVPYVGTTPIWHTEANVNSADDGSRPATAFGAAWQGSLFTKLAPIGVSTIHQYSYTQSPTFGLIAEQGSASEGNPYLPYWVEYWIDHLFMPGAKILTVANVPAGFDVLAVANPPDFANVKVLVVNRQVPATSTAASVLLAGATSTATRVRTIDSTTNLVNGPALSNLGAVQTSNLQLNGYSLSLVEFDTGTGIIGPVVTGVSPNHGPPAGGTSVTITGTGFTGATAVTFGSTAATGFTVNGPTQITATSPAGTGTVDVTVTTPNGTSPITVADRFTYDVPPGPPLNVTALGGEASATVYWSAPTSSGTSAITSYTVTSSPGGITATVAGGARSATVSPLVDGTSYTFTVTASNDSGPGPPSAPSNAVTPGRGQYHALTPARVLDTRSGLGAPAARVGPGGSLDVQITGQGGVPSTGVAAVVLNATVTDTTAASYLTVWPAGLPQPLASNLNWTSGKTVANLVEAAVGVDGKVSLFNAFGSTDVIFDVAGYVATATVTPGPDGLYNPVVPNRVLDTRDGTGGVPVGRVGPGQTIKVRVAGTPNIPSTGVAAVVLNVTATDPTAPSYLTVWPTGVAQPLASNLNFVAGQTVPNRVIVQVGTDGSTGGWVSIYNPSGQVNVIADVGGWFTDSSNVAATGSLFLGVTPARILDTRDGTGGFSIKLGPGQTIAATVAGQGGVPAMNAPIPPSAVVLNVTVTGTTAASYLTVWPNGATRPLASDLNWAAGLTVPNLAVVKLGADGKIGVYNAYGATDVIIDVVGWYG